MVLLYFNPLVTSPRILVPPLLKGCQVCALYLYNIGKQKNGDASGILAMTTPHSPLKAGLSGNDPGFTEQEYHQVSGATHVWIGSCTKKEGS
ncbi:hypothetical protein CYMTET_16115 [Cymbomonas tetramitiformis]|uniref:Uncharacterized protein n=1 Tax=Cymbomonas tetramitiformis TaxID=36881 RepID=A0AAE0GD03_9CHLO|nr:hypothetical protein CYMTET_16115 [Cymbomonas tetramitiformis]